MSAYLIAVCFALRSCSSSRVDSDLWLFSFSLSSLLFANWFITNALKIIINVKWRTHIDCIVWLMWLSTSFIYLDCTSFNSNWIPEIKLFFFIWYWFNNFGNFLVCCTFNDWLWCWDHHHTFVSFCESILFEIHEWFEIGLPWFTDWVTGWLSFFDSNQGKVRQ